MRVGLHPFVAVQLHCIIKMRVAFLYVHYTAEHVVYIYKNGMCRVTIIITVQVKHAIFHVIKRQSCFDMGCRYYKIYCLSSTCLPLGVEVSPVVAFNSYSLSSPTPSIAM